MSSLARRMIDSGPTPSERPHDRRFVRPSGDCRERPVLCVGCRQRGTWAIDALCTVCHPIEETDQP